MSYPTGTFGAIIPIYTWPSNTPTSLLSTQVRLGQLCASDPLLFVSTTGTLDDFDAKFHSQRYAASQSKPQAPHHSPPFSENPPSREPKQAGSWVGHASRASHRMVHSKTYFDWRQPQATRQRFTNSTVSWMDSAGNILRPHHTTRAVAPATVHTRINMQFLRSMRT